MQAAPFKYLDYPQVCELVGLTKSPIRERIKAGTFPAPVALSARCVRFRSDLIARWMEEQSVAVDSSKTERTTKASKARLARFPQGACAV